MDDDAVDNPKLNLQVLPPASIEYATKVLKGALSRAMNYVCK